MEALVSGKEGFPLLSKLLVALLQTLLQDEETEVWKTISSQFDDASRHY